MQIVEAQADAAVQDAYGEPAYRLRGGMQYVVHDREAALGLRSSAVRLVQGLDRVLPRYQRQPLTQQRMLVPFIGRGGDALVLGACLEALKEQWPKVRVDVTCPDGPREVLSIVPAVDRLLTYPLPSDDLANYDYYMCLEDVDAVPDGAARCLSDVFSRCLGTPPPTKPVRIEIPTPVRAAWHWPGRGKLRIGLHTGQIGNVRAYLPDLAHELASTLARAQYDVYLIGRFDPRCDLSAPAFPSGVFDLTGRTPTTLDLAAALVQLDALITSDGLPMHLAGALELPTLALFTATDPILASDYPSVRAVPSETACAPCRIAMGKCPLHHDHCVAWRDEAVQPQAILQQLHALTTKGALPAPTAH